MDKTIFEQLEGLAAKDDQGGFIYRNFEAHEAAERIILKELTGRRGEKVAVEYLKLKKEMEFEYGND